MDLCFSIIIPIHKPNFDFLVDCFASIKPQINSNDQVICVLNGNNQKEEKEIIGLIPNTFDYIVSNKLGVSNARNDGIKVAKNEFIIFVDCDDVIGANMLCLSRQTIKDYNPDFISFSDSTEINALNKLGNSQCLFNKSEILNLWKGKPLNKPIGFLFKSSCNHIYKKTIIDKNNLFFNSDQKIGEDTILNFEYMLNSNSFLINNSIMYYYRQSDSNTTTKSNKNANNDIGVLIKNYINVLQKYALNDGEYLLHLYKEILFNYLPYIFRSYIFCKAFNHSLLKRRRLVKDCVNKGYFINAINILGKKDTATKKQSALLFLLKLKLYLIIALIYKTRKTSR